MDPLLGFSDLVVRPTAVLLIAGLVVLAMRRTSAAARHLAWTAGLAAALLVPFVGGLAPDVSVPASERVSRFVEAGPFAEPNAPAVGGDAAPAAAVAADSREAGVPVPWRAIWLVGAVASLGILGLQLLGLRRIEVASQPAPRRFSEAFDRARERLGITRSVGLRLGAADAMPMTWGVTRPRVLLPSSATEWPDEQVSAVLLHELAHVRRHDVALQRVGEVARAILWFNPLSWIAVRRMLVEREHACDDVVLKSGLRGSDYAHQLLGMAHSLRSNGAAAALPMARKSQMTGRLLAILDERRARRGAGGAGPALTLAIGAAAALVVGAMRPAPVGGEQPPPPASVTSASASPAPPASTPPQATTLAQDCWSASRSDGNSNTNHDPGLITVEVRTGRCLLSMRVVGSAILRPDSTGFSWLEPGGRVSIRETRGDRQRDIVLRGGSASGVERSGTENGRALSQAAVDDWLAANLPPLLGRSQARLEVGPAP